MKPSLFNRYRFAGEDRPCLVLGSAPNPQLPTRLRDRTTLVCVNSSGWAAREAGWPVPSLTVMAGFKLTADHTEADRSALAGLKTDTLLLIKQFPHDRPASEAKAKSLLNQFGYSYRYFVTMSDRARRLIRRRAIGTVIDGEANDGKPSNGILTVCIALQQGAPQVILAGFSFTRDGHHYDREGKRPRQHQGPDQAAIAGLLKKGWPLATTEPELAAACGLPLIT